jgi:hypothetical protein
MAIKKTNKDMVRAYANETNIAMASSRTQYRGSSAGNVKLNEQLSNISCGFVPYMSGSNGVISISEVVKLVQKAYFNVAAFRNTIDTQAEFSNSPLHFKGGSEKSRKFYSAWYDKIGGADISSQFFREYYRSNNIFFYKTFFEIRPEDLQKLKDEYGGGEIPSTLLGKKIPLRYILLDPSDIRCDGTAAFSDATYSKLLNPYEIARLKNPSTEEERRFLMSLPPEARKQIQTGKQVLIELDEDKLIAIFGKKQDYEPFAVPIYYPVLFDINLKLEFKKAELAIAKSIDYMILLITLGDKDNGVDKKVADSIQQLFKSESVGRVLVADYTTEAQFIIPELDKLLGPAKYEAVNRDIASGLMNIFFEDQKFANGLIKTKIFLERLNEARQTYINKFLVPEMQLIANELGLRDMPTPEFEDINVNDEIQLEKNYIRLVELGIITPEEYFELSQTGILPTKEASLESQKTFKKQKDDGLYEPLMGKQKDDELAAAGRPGGSKAPQTTKKVSPQKSVGFSMVKLKDIAVDITKLSETVEAEYKKRFEIQRMSAKHKTAAFEIAKAIVTNEPKESWESMVVSYFEDASNVLKQPNDELLTIAATHGLDTFSAAILNNSKYEPNQD